MADGTVKQVNPFTGVEVWTVPGRGKRVLLESEQGVQKTPIPASADNAHCSFCFPRYFDTAPEKARVVAENDGYTFQHRIAPSEYLHSPAIFRRVSNLFEIVSIEYWQKNFNYRLSRRNLQWKEEYIGNAQGLQHVLDMIDFKLRRTGKSDEEITAIPTEEKIILADAFFGGGHEMIIAKQHYSDTANDTSDLFATGDLSEDEHFQYFLFIIDAMKDII